MWAENWEWVREREQGERSEFMVEGVVVVLSNKKQPIYSLYRYWMRNPDPSDPTDESQLIYLICLPEREKHQSKWIIRP